MRPTPKKSETLEIRIPYEAKRAFMARCRRDGRSASEAVRAYIDGEIRPPVTAPRAPKLLKLALGAAAIAAVAAAAAPSLAGQAPQAKVEAFQKLDANHDGQLSLAEYVR